MNYTFSFIEGDEDLNYIKQYEHKKGITVNRIFENFSVAEFRKQILDADSMGYDEITYIGKITENVRKSVISTGLRVTLQENNVSPKTTVHILCPFGFLPFIEKSGSLVIDFPTINDYYKQLSSIITSIKNTYRSEIVEEYSFLSSGADSIVYAPKECCAAGLNFLTEQKLNSPEVERVCRTINNSIRTKSVPNSIKKNVENTQENHIYVLPSYYKEITSGELGEAFKKGSDKFKWIPTKIGHIQSHIINEFETELSLVLQKYADSSEEDRNKEYEKLKVYINQNHNLFDTYLLKYVCGDLKKFKTNKNTEPEELISTTVKSDDRYRTGYYKHSKPEKNIDTYWDKKVTLENSEGVLDYFAKASKEAEDKVNNVNGEGDKAVEKLHNWKYYFTDKAGQEKDKKKPRFDITYYKNKGYPTEYAYQAYKYDMKIWDIEEKINTLKLQADTLADDDSADVEVLDNIKKDINDYTEEIEKIKITQQALIEVREKDTVDSYADPKLKDKSKMINNNILNFWIALLYDPKNKNLYTQKLRIIKSIQSLIVSQSTDITAN